MFTVRSRTVIWINNRSVRYTIVRWIQLKIRSNTTPLLPVVSELHTMKLLTGLLVGRGKKSNFAGFSGTNSRKKWPISREFRGNFQGQFRWKMIGKEWLIAWELPEQISLESDWFCADLRNIFNETRRSIWNRTFQLSLLSMIKQIKESGY